MKIFRGVTHAAVAALAMGAVTWLAPPAALAVDEVVVTTQRREALLQEVPVAVTAISEQALKERQINDAFDLQRVVPSLNMFNNITSPTNLSPSLRGGLQQDASLVTAESPFGIYVDDIYVGRLNGNNAALTDIERVEVLRGPQGTLYGRNTGYGAIKFISRTPDPDGKGWFDARAGAGNYSQYIASATAGGPITDTLAASIAGQFRNKDDQFDNVFDGSESGLQRDYAVRGKLRFTPSDKLDIVLQASFTDAEHDSLQMGNGTTPGIPETCAGFGNPGGVCLPGQTAQFTTDDLVFTNGEFGVNAPAFPFGPAPLRNSKPQGDTQQTIAGLTLTYAIAPDTTLKSITAVVDTQDFFQTDFSGNSGATYDPDDPMTSPGGFVGAADVDNQQFTQELQLLGTTLDDRLKYIAGVFFLREDGQQQFGWHFFTPLSQSAIDVETESFAVFGEFTYRLWRNLSATAGLRYTDESKIFQFNYERLDGNFFDLVVAPGFFPGRTDQVNLTTDFTEWTPKFAVDYLFEDVGPADSLLTYVQAAKGFKGAGFSAIALASVAPVGAYDPETNWTYEAGLKADWLDRRLRTNLAYFYSDIEAIQQNSTGPPPAFEFPVENNGDARIQGLEFELTLTPVTGLNLFLNGALLDGEYRNLDKYPDGAAANAERLYGVPADTPQTPDYQVSAGFDYTVDLPGNLLGDLSFGADYYRIDDYITAATNDFRNSGWDMWNAFIGVNVADNWQLRLTGKNLADDYIITAGSRGLGGFVPLAPREVLFTVNYRLGGFQ
jgi:iron complex outermembrane receptor protein